MTTGSGRIRWGEFYRRIEWHTILPVAIPGITAFFLGLSLSYTTAQAFTFGASCFLFSIWLIDRSGGEVGWFTESLRFRILVSLAFVVIYSISHFEITYDGTLYCRPVTALMIALIFLPYAVTAGLESIFGD